MGCYSNYSNIGFCCHFVVAAVLMSWCAGAAVTQIKTTHKPTAATSIFMQKLTTAATSTFIQKLTTEVPPTTAGIQVSIDYDYAEMARAAKPTKYESEVGTTGTSNHMNTISQAMMPSPINWAKLPAGLDGVLGEQYEWLRERVKVLQRHGLKDQVDALQDKYPSVNLTLLYDFYSAGGQVYDADDEYYYHNGSYHLRPGYMDAEDGYWHNETFYPSLVEGQEMEDGHYFNGTWHTGEGGVEDGYYHNGTYYGGEVEIPDREDGYYHNDTFYPGQEREEDEGLMWWQLHHPKWRDGGINNIDNSKSLPIIHNQQQQQYPLRKPEAQPILPSSRHYHQPHPQQPRRPPVVPQSPHKLPANHQPHPQQPLTVPQVAHKLPTHHQRLPVKRPTSVHRQPLLQAKATKNGGGTPLQHQGMTGTHPKNAVSSGADVGRAGKAAMVGNAPLTEQVSHQGSSKTPATTSWGIALAVIFGIAVVLAPLACLLYKYRQEKRIKKRTLLRRSEHGSVDEGIMDAMVMTELGERADSRVRHIRKDEAGKLKFWKHRPVGSKRDSTHKSQSRSRYELQAPPTRKCFANIHDDPSVIIT